MMEPTRSSVPATQHLGRIIRPEYDGPVLIPVPPGSGGPAAVTLQAALDALASTGDEAASLMHGPYGRIQVIVSSAGVYGHFCAALTAEAVSSWAGRYADGEPWREVLDVFAATDTEWLPAPDGEPPLLAVTFHHLTTTPSPGGPEEAGDAGS
jgi:NAD(P)-dependent dehydrogenase (short-subunit alcohol dehydrogenase family)